MPCDYLVLNWIIKIATGYHCENKVQKMLYFGIRTDTLLISRMEIESDFQSH